MKKTFNIYTLGWLAVLGLFNVITFVTPNEINDVSKFDTLFWIAYACITVCFIAQLVCTYFISKTNSLQKTFYNITLIRVSIIALIAMFIVGGLCMAIIQIPEWIGIIACCVVLTINIIAYAKASVAVDVISSIDQKIKVKTLFIKMLMADAQALMSKAQSEEMSKLTRNVYEAIRYSDPMSDSALSSVEEKISTQFERFSKSVSSNDLTTAQTCCNELLSSITERNTKCKILK